jgi:hypothetical protein
MDRENRRLSDVVARTLSMWFMAGMTIARFGVPQEKNNVASLNICQRSFRNEKEEYIEMHIQDIPKLLSDTSFSGG